MNLNRRKVSEWRGEAKMEDGTTAQGRRRAGLTTPQQSPVLVPNGEQRR
jgi:hypothetical protein